MHQRKHKVKFDTFYIILFVSLIVGMMLRVHLIRSQILIDDEWHSMNFVIGRSFHSILTNHSLGANSIPMNIYRWILLKIYGFSELPLRLLSLITGIGSLVILSIFIKRIFNKSCAIYFSFLIAMSPCLIFYSRMCRPYSAAMFFSNLSILSFFYWIIYEKPKWAWVYAITGAIGVYFHLYSLITVSLPIIFLISSKYIKKGGVFYIKDNLPKIKFIALIGFSLLMLIGILNLPANINHLWWGKFLGADKVAWKTIINYMMLLSGSPNIILNIIFYILFVVGYIKLWREARWMVLIFSIIIISFHSAFLIAHQDGCHAAIQLIRYSISIVPIVILLVSNGLDCMVKWIQSLPLCNDYKIKSISSYIIPFSFIIFLFLRGPLFQIYKYPNNFTNHSAFQDNYTTFTWDESRMRDLGPDYTMKKEWISPFYFRLADDKDTQKIIEYPMLIGDNYNLYFYLQHFHKKEILVAFFPLQLDSKSLLKDWVHGMMPIDFMLNRLKDRSKLKFENIVNLLDYQTIKKFKANYIILHKDILKEFFPYHDFKNNPWRLPIVEISKIVSRKYNDPIYEDNNIIVFRIK